MKTYVLLVVAAIVAEVLFAAGQTRIGKPLFVSDLTDTNGLIRVELATTRADIENKITLKADKVKTVVTTTILDGETVVETNYYPTVYLDDIAPFTAATNKIEMARRAIENADLSTVSGLSAALEAVKNTLGE